MKLDLTGLADVDRPATGEPLMVPLGVISCDQDQPRRYIDEPALHELAESIRAIGVVQPISLCPDPGAAGRYIINYGERRFRAAAIAGLDTIPAFVHRTPNSYTQVAENLHRADLSPMEIALFIQLRLDDGEMKHEIAAKLGYKKSYVTEHLALLESPACVEKAYANGVASARTLYDLRRLHEEFPKQVDDWIASGVEVTRESILAFGQKVRHDELARDLATVPRHLNVVSPEATSAILPPPAPGSDLSVASHPVPSSAVRTYASPELDSVGSPSRYASHERTAVPTDAKRPPRRLRIKVNYGGRSAMIDETSVVRIRYDDGGVAEVRLADTVVVAAVAA
jgi:ParB family chromosome partitioning protein